MMRRSASWVSVDARAEVSTFLHSTAVPGTAEQCTLCKHPETAAATF